MKLIVLNSTNKFRFNCVLFARSKCPPLPFGLWTLGNKINIINSYTPLVGEVAVMRVGLWGHVGIVKTVRGSQITITEANYKFGKITERTGTKEEFRIVGYFCPDNLIPIKPDMPNLNFKPSTRLVPLFRLKFPDKCEHPDARLYTTSNSEVKGCIKKWGFKFESCLGFIYAPRK